MTLGDLTIVDVGAGGILAVVILFILTDRLVWHKRLRAVESERDRWQQIAFKSLGITETLTVSSEVTADVLTRLPDPSQEEVP